MSSAPSSYRVAIRTPADRKSKISSEAQASTEKLKFYHFRNDVRDLPVILLPIDLPIYRVVNARTRDEQLSLIAEGRYEDHFFDSSNQEKAELQQAQHEILWEFSCKGQGETIVPIYEELLDKKRQTEPILIDKEGVVINGNRRLAAMRELSLSTDKGLDEFAHVRCQVLPDEADTNDYLEIEFRLQMTRETKLPYTWTNEARICKQLRDANVSIQRIADMRGEDEKQVTVLIQMFELADRYLKDWIEKPGNYHILNSTRQAFKQMVTRRNTKRTLQQKEVADAFGFFVVENREKLDDRAYKFINAIEDNPPDFFESFSENVGFKPTDISNDESEGEELLLEIGDGPSQKDREILSLIPYLKQMRSDRDLTTLALEAIENVTEILADKKKNPGALALKLSNRALRALRLIEVNTANANTKNELADNISIINGLSKQLMDQLAQ